MNTMPTATSSIVEPNMLRLFAARLPHRSTKPDDRLCLSRPTPTPSAGRPRWGNRPFYILLEATTEGCKFAAAAPQVEVVVLPPGETQRAIMVFDAIRRQRTRNRIDCRPFNP